MNKVAHNSGYTPLKQNIAANRQTVIYPDVYTC